MPCRTQTDYVATRWYRAPEILAGSSAYGTAVDLWSLGCIFGEMLGGKPVFPGTSTLDQLEKIGDAIGAPSADDLEALNSPFTAEMLDQMNFPMSDLGDQGREKKPFLKGHPPPSNPNFNTEASWRHLYPKPKAEENAILLLDLLMKYNPSQRITAQQGLEHPYCAQFHEPATEVASSAVVRLAD